MRLPRRKPRARLELLPLMDVVFIVLVFLVYAMLNMSEQKGIDVSLPQAASASAQGEEGPVLSIAADGSLYWEKRRIEAADLQGLLLPGRPDEIVRVLADRAAPFSAVVAALDALRAAGRLRISCAAVAP